MNKRLQKIQAEIKAVEDSRRAFIAKFEKGLKDINSEIEQREENLQQALSANDFDTFETESDKLALLRQKKQHFEAGLKDAETTSIGDYDKIHMEIREAVTEAAKAKAKELFQHTTAMEAIGREVDTVRADGEALLRSVQGWTARPQNSFGMDYSASIVRWAFSGSDADAYTQAAREHPEWAKLK